MNDEIDGRRIRQQRTPTEFTKPSFQSIPVDRRMRVLRDDKPNSGMRETRKGSNHPNF
jgi:hypothetical protein